MVQILRIGALFVAIVAAQQADLNIPDSLQGLGPSEDDPRFTSWSPPGPNDGYIY